MCSERYIAVLEIMEGGGVNERFEVQSVCIDDGSYPGYLTQERLEREREGERERKYGVEIQRERGG